MLRTVLSRAIFFTLLFSMFCCYVSAVPLVISHQGRLLDAGDAPLSGTFTIIYSIYDAPVGGTQLWMEDHVGVVVSDGLFSVELGSTVPLPADIFDGSGGGGSGGATRYLQVQISGQPAISPRTPLLSTPSAIVSGSVYGETTMGSSKARGIITKKPGGGSTAGFVTTLDADSDGDGLAESSATTDVDGGSASRRLKSHNLGSSGEDGVDVSLRCIPDSIIELNTMSDGTTLLSSYSAKQGSTGRTKRTAAFALDGSRSQDDEVVSISSGARRRLEVHNLGSSGQDGVGDLRCTPDSIVAENTISVGGELKTLLYSAKQGKTGSASGKRTINPGGGSSETEEVCDTAGASLKLTIDSTPARISTNFTVGKQSSRVRLDSDSDGDSLPEAEIDQLVTPTTSNVAIKTRGTGADHNRVLAIQNGATPTDVNCVGSIDDDGDTVPESEISQHLTPTSSSLAIKTKGVPVQRTQTISADCDDQSSVLSLDTDDDGDGLSEFSGQMSCNGSSAKGVVTGVAPGTTNVMKVTWEVDATGPSIRLTNGGFDFHVMNGDGNVLRNTSNVVVADMDRDGNLYLANNLSVGAAGGTHHIDVAGGAYCDGTNWVNASDRNSKENFEKVDGGEILEKISDLEITKWNYKGDDDAQHIGPTAQDFKKTFGVGADDKSISTIDPSGIALAAIKELYAQLKQKDQKLDDQAKLIIKLQEKLSVIEKQLKKQ